LRFWDAEEPGAMAAQDADTLRLVARIKAGDRAALVGLYVRYYEPLCRYARMVLRDDHEAEDIAQQTFLSAQSALKRYEARDATPFRAWLFGITRNKLRREVARRQAITPSATDAVDTLRDRAVTGADELASRWLTNWDLAEAIETLPGPHRQVLALRFLLDLSRADVAALLGRSEGAVQQLQRRALDELSRRMAQSWIRPG
jgi:RNA polymerase sigma-70 factor (ECF subfamily)